MALASPTDFNIIILVGVFLGKFPFATVYIRVYRVLIYRRDVLR